MSDNDNEPDKASTLSKLPAICAVSLPFLGGQVALIKRGVMGYFVAPPGTLKSTFNTSVGGVTPAQEQAMLAGSMFGWDVPGADPDMYDEFGK